MRLLRLSCRVIPHAGRVGMNKITDWGSVINLIYTVLKNIWCESTRMFNLLQDRWISDTHINAVLFLERGSICTVCSHAFMHDWGLCDWLLGSVMTFMAQLIKGLKSLFYKFCLCSRFLLPNAWNPDVTDLQQIDKMWMAECPVCLFKLPLRNVQRPVFFITLLAGSSDNRRCFVYIVASESYFTITFYELFFMLLPFTVLTRGSSVSCTLSYLVTQHCINSNNFLYMT